MFDIEEQDQLISELTEAQINMFLIYNVFAIALSIGAVVLIFSLTF